MEYIFLAAVIFLIAYLNISKRNKSYGNIYQSVNDALLSSDELIKHAAEIAKYHSVSKQKKGYNYLFVRLKKNYAIITQAYRRLNSYGKMNLPLCPASEWLLDNFYIIEEQYKELQKNMDNNFYKKLYVVNDGPFINCPRIFAVALEIVSHTDGHIDKDQLIEFINSYQTVNTLSMSELWALAPMLKMALLEKISHVCENIIASQEQWNQAEEIKNKSCSETLEILNLRLQKSSKPKFSYIEHILKILKKMEIHDSNIIGTVEDYLLKFDTDIEKVVKHEHQEQAAFQVTIGNCITSIRLVISLNWEDIFESLSIVEKILLSDPVGIYTNMDNDSRTYYRRQIERIAYKTNVTETMAARKAIYCAVNCKSADNEIVKHIGYYLIGKGRPVLYKELTDKKYKNETASKNFTLYFLSIILFTLLIINFFTIYCYKNSSNIILTIITVFILGIPASELAISIVNWIVTHTYEPSFLPKLEYENGIPDDMATMVVVPTIFPDIERTVLLFDKLEVTYLSNHERNIYFALLGDLKDSDTEVTELDQSIIDYAVNRVSELNHKYSLEEDSFYLFIRSRTYSSSQQKWIGWERKRGAIINFNDFLRDFKADKFLTISGNLEKIKSIKYIITLDADTQLTIGMAKKLIGSISHPLNKPVIDSSKGVVTDGYGLIQPRVDIDIQSSNKSFFAKIFAGVGGIDTYTTAISDIYQDLFKEGIFTGKGIYDLDTFKQILHNSIPENSVLSHDLLEGSYIRVGLATDIELIDGYPEKYNSYMMRLQRWVRGDWQLIRWLSSYVINREGKKVKNPLSAISKWKIFDNLRRSAVPTSIIILLLASFLFLPGNLGVWIMFSSTIIFLPLITGIIDYIYLKYYNTSVQKYNGNIIYGIKAVFLQTLLLFIFMPYQSYILSKSILKTLYRVFISKKNLLEWVTAADAEKNARNTKSSYFKNMMPSMYKIIIALPFVFIFKYETAYIYMIISIIWFFSPYIAWKISQPIIPDKYHISQDDMSYLRKISFKTWNFYKTFAGSDNNYLPIDNYQISPIEKTANRTSPTNIGFLLISILSAKDLGYISTDSFISRIKNTLSTIIKLEKWNGHLYNWYDTKTLEVLNPRYVSTVDSGNLAGYYITLRQGLYQIIKNPLLSVSNIRGILDAALLSSDSCPNITNLLKSYLDKNEFNLYSYYLLLDEIQKHEDELKKSDDISEMVESYMKELEYYYPIKIMYIDDYSAASGNSFHAALKESIDTADTLLSLKQYYESLLNSFSSKDNKIKYIEINSHKTDFARLIEHIDHTVNEVCLLTKQLDILIEDTKFKPLYDSRIGLFSIGYNVQDNKLTNSYYDLLASEARITSYIAVAKKEIPVSHWFKLGRSLVDIEGYLSLVSWTGTMFEYLMPSLIMKNFKNSLFDETYLTVIKSQIRYGKMRKLLWGTSESGFYTFDLHLNYQYKAFGVPELGLKRGLINDMVISPYSSMLALSYSPNEALLNLKELSKCNIEGSYGLYEAVDFTPGRIPSSRNYSVVESYMAHHQGMILTSINNFLNNDIMINRFHSDPVIKTGEFLLQEKIPLRVIITKENKEEVEPFTNMKQKEISVVREFSDVNTSQPVCSLLSNGSYTVMITVNGTGYSKNENIMLTRWHEDKLSGKSGYFIFIRDLLNDNIWSNTYEPVCSSADKTKVKFSQDKADFTRWDDKIETRTEICVSPEDNCEIRRVTLTNHRDIPATLEITSYLETVLATQMSDLSHPAFSNLFIKTEFINNCSCLLASRRPRCSDADTLFLFHLLTVNGTASSDIEYETSRYKFIGRTKDIKKACSLYLPLSNTTGAVLDPIMSLRRSVCIEPGKSAVLCYTTGFSNQKETILDMAHRYNEYSNIARAFDLSHIRNQMSIKYLNLNVEDITCFDDMLSHMIFNSPLKKKYQECICKNKYGQSGLWSYGISGDLPIMLISISKIEDIDIVKTTIKAHEYYRSKGFKVDLVILNEDESSYLQPLSNALRDIVISSHARDLLGCAGGVYIVNSNLLSVEEKALLITAARIVLNSNRHIKPQIKTGITKYIQNELIIESKPNYKTTEVSDETYNLDFNNGYGGFNTQDNEYVIKLRDEMTTPAPWSNIISNENFGFIVTESGSGYVWSENSRENKLTPWSNDPVSDPPGEIIFLRDDNTGYFWSLTPLPVREKEPYTIVHGLGYSVFKHNSNGISQMLTVFVPVNESVKLSIIKLKNCTDSVRNLSIYYYVKPVLGVSDYITEPYINTQFDPDLNLFTARNCFNSDYSERIMYISSSYPVTSYTGDRREFLGQCCGLSNPEVMKYEELSGTVGSGLDSCCVIKNKLTIEPGGEKNIILILGQQKNMQFVSESVNKFCNYNNANIELEKAKAFWKSKNGIIHIQTPEKSLDTLFNSFLLYQVVSSRLWARSAFYQSGGAFGFRDQLQDILSILYTFPELARKQILLHASHQFFEGDVLHWWHPGDYEKGVRTKFSDDLVWLAFTTAEYIQKTGDYSILDEKCNFVEGITLDENDDEKYGTYHISDNSAVLYDHCILAVEKALSFGDHGIPLMGTGDWNDGMNTVGNKGKGESIWLGWFLCSTMDKLIPICEYMKDYDRADKYRELIKYTTKSIDDNAWDGSWYLRAYFDDGTPLGSSSGHECRIDSIAQSWAVIANAPNTERLKRAMHSVENYLVKKDHGLIMLFTPPFDIGDLKPGYIKGYVPGVRENGGQYTHAAVWVISAFAKLGNGNTAVDLFNMINPVNHTITPIQCLNYKVEPYVMAADVYSVEPHIGHGGWTWYTGSASWMYKVCIEDILGFTKSGKTLSINPCIPDSWNEASIEYKYLDTSYTITIKNTSKGKNAKELYIDGIKNSNNLIELKNDLKKHIIELSI